MSTARRMLEQVHSRTSLESLETARVIDALAADVPADLEARDAALVDALAAIEDLAIRAMRILVDLALADDTSIAPPSRKVFATTIARYADDLGLLEQRVRDLAARGRAPNVEVVVEGVLGAARRTLALRASLVDGLLALARELATAAIADADKRARDRTLDEAPRKRWSGIRRELEAIAADPSRISRGPWADRVALWPEQLDEPAPEPEVTFADMIELD